MMRLEKSYISKVKLKRWGRYYAILTLAVGFAAVSSGNNLLYFFLSALLSIMALSGFVSFITLRGIEISIIPPEEIYARTLNYIKVRVKNKSFLPSLLFYVKKTEKEKSFIEMIPAKSQKDCLLPYYFENRGYQLIDHLYFGTSFPFSFTIREVYYPIKEKVLVFPHIHKLTKGEIVDAKSRNIGWGTDSTKEGAIGDFIGLREYQHSDKVSKIHWKKLKEEKIFVKKFTDEEFQDLNLEISSSASEKEIELIASLAVHYLELGHRVALIVDGKQAILPDSGIAQKLLILKKLALLGNES